MLKVLARCRLTRIQGIVMAALGTFKRTHILSFHLVIVNSCMSDFQNVAVFELMSC